MWMRKPTSWGRILIKLLPDCSGETRTRPEEELKTMRDGWAQGLGEEICGVFERKSSATTTCAIHGAGLRVKRLVKGRIRCENDQQA